MLLENKHVSFRIQKPYTVKVRFVGMLGAILLIFSTCKKKIDCGCNSNEAGENLPVTGGELFYDENNSRWLILTMPNRGAAYYYFPCNSGQDSLKVILQGTSQNETIAVEFSGKVKAPCSNEQFVEPTPAFFTTFNYIVLDSLRRF